MKKIMIIVLLSPLAASLTYAGDVPQNNKQTGHLTVVIAGLENDKGKVMVGLFDSKEGYSSGKEPFRGCSAEIKDRKAECTFQGIPYGTYAIKAYHDKNRNGKLDMNFMGIPNETYGFSNNARGNFGPAKWEDAKFIINSRHMSMHITFQER